MKRPDGSVSTTPEENADVFKAHFGELFGRDLACDPTVLDLLEQQTVREGLDNHPTDEEIYKAMSMLRNTAPGDSSLRAQASKCLLRLHCPS